MFVKWHHIERFDKTECDGIVNGYCYVSFKLDGTNSSIWADVDGNIHCGSRKRELTLEDDNGGFMKWVLSDDTEAAELREWCVVHPNFHIFGEWGVGRIGNLKKYICSKENHLYLFGACLSVEEVDEEGNPIVSWVHPADMLNDKILAKYMIPIIEIENPTFEQLMTIADNNHYLLPQDVKGEGIVIDNPDFINRYGKNVLAKIVLDEYKQNKSKKQNSAPKDGEVESWIVDKYCTEAEMSKTAAKICNTLEIDNVTDTGKGIGMFLNTLFHDAILQECDDWGNNKRVKTVDFPMMKNLTFIAGRKFLGLQEVRLGHFTKIY